MKKIINVIKKIKIRHMIILIFLFMFNAYAWFIYSTEVSSGITAHVKSWKIVFQAGENEIVNYVNIPVNDIFPGMDDFNQQIAAYNESETEALISFEILEARILDTTYKTVEGYTDEGTVAPVGTLTSVELANNLRNNYPFVIDISVTSGQVSQDASATYTVSVNWNYESGDDNLDTEWGHRAYDYNNDHPDDPSIQLNVKIKAEQV